jgi:hypothetical protein
MLLANGKWSEGAAGIENIKWYSSAIRAVKYGLENQDGTAYAVYEDQEVDCWGRVMCRAAVASGKVGLLQGCLKPNR